MKINIIYHDFSSNVIIDVEVLSFIIKKLKVKLKPVYVNVNNYKCEEADINLFIETINYSYFDKAKYNIFVPNQQYFSRNQIELLDSFDMIFAKSKYIYEIFKPLVSEEKLEYIGWRSPDISIPAAVKSYEEYLVFYQDAVFFPVQNIIDLWKEDFPNLNIILQVNRKDLKLKEQCNIKYIDNKDIDVEKFHSLFNKCGVHLCLNEIESYSHMINQCKLVKSIPVAINGGPMKELVNSSCGFPLGGKKKRLKQSLGSKYTLDKDHLIETIEKIRNTSEATLKIMGNNGREQAIKNHGECDVMFKESFHKIFDECRKKKQIKKEKSKEIDDDKLPTVSIITPTYNRSKLFPLAILNYNCINYPREKIEWIIVDDSDDKEQIKSLLPPEEKWADMRLQYHKLEEKMSIGEKRNYAVSKSNNEVIVCMDDDDYYPQDSVRERVTTMIKNNKKCVCCTTIGCFHIQRYISIISAPPFHDPYFQRVSEATLCFYKSFWEEGKFSDRNTSESEGLVSGRIQDICELEFTKVINSLLHDSNTSTRDIPPKQTANGCHFKWNDKLFKFITNLGK